MKSLTKEKRYDLIDAFSSTSRYLDDLLNINNIHFELMFQRIYPAELQLYKANASDTEAAFLDLNLSIHNDIVSTKIYEKRDDFNFDINNECDFRIFGRILFSKLSTIIYQKILNLNECLRYL